MSGEFGRTNIDAAMQWHRDALAGLKPAITYEPQIGFFKRRLVRLGPWVPARIYLHQEIDTATGELTADEALRCEVAGKDRDPIDEWTWIAGQPITESEYHYLMALRSWAARRAPDHPSAQDRNAVDFNKTPLPF